MYRKLFNLLAVLMLASIVLSACGAPAAPAPAATEALPRQLIRMLT